MQGQQEKRGKTERVYVKVNSDFDATGYMLPRTIIWTDGRLLHRGERGTLLLQKPEISELHHRAAPLHDLALLHELLEQSPHLFLQRWVSSHAQAQALLFKPSLRCLIFRLLEFFLSTIIDKFKRRCCSA